MKEENFIGHSAGREHLSLNHCLILGTTSLSSIDGYDRLNISKNIEFTLKCVDNLTDALAEYNTVCEINAYLGEEKKPVLLEIHKKFIGSCKKKKISFTVGSDAHNLSGIGDVKWAVKLIQNGWVQPA